jgi:hypothetical protein
MGQKEKKNYKKLKSIRSTEVNNKELLFNINKKNLIKLL